jgi:hypothetical protein
MLFVIRIDGDVALMPCIWPGGYQDVSLYTFRQPRFMVSFPISVQRAKVPSYRQTSFPRTGLAAL